MKAHWVAAWVLAGLAGAAGVAWQLVPGSFEPKRAPPSSAAAATGPPLQTEAEILASTPSQAVLVRLQAQPRIHILLFPDLESQGATLNRLAALIEKRGLPRDRVLSDAELAAAIGAAQSTPATYYYGHNYRLVDVERFFVLAQQQGVVLGQQELWLKEQLSRWRLIDPAATDSALISVPGIRGPVDALARQTILRHEIGHGHFFIHPAFAEHVRRTWRRDFTAVDRAAFTAFLAREGYDPTQEDIMINESMAYLIFTSNDQFFSPGDVGLSPERIARLRAMLLHGAPQVPGLIR